MRILCSQKWYGQTEWSRASHESLRVGTCVNQFHLGFHKTPILVPFEKKKIGAREQLIRKLAASL